MTVNIILAIFLGSFFGFALYKAGASNPQKIISMLRLEDLSLMKTILFGIGFSSILLFIANSAGVFDISHLSVKSVNLGVIVGGLIFGLGFGAVGTCPGTCMAAASGIDFKKALGAILGGLTGAFAFSVSYGWLQGLGLFSAMDMGPLTLSSISERYPAIFDFGFIGLLAAGILLAAIAFLLPQFPAMNRQPAALQQKTDDTITAKY